MTFKVGGRARQKLGGGRNLVSPHLTLALVWTLTNQMVLSRGPQQRLLKLYPSVKTVLGGQN